MGQLREVTTVSAWGKYDASPPGEDSLSDSDDNAALTDVYKVLLWFILRVKSKNPGRGKDELQAIWQLLNDNKELFESLKGEEEFKEMLYSMSDAFSTVNSLRIALLKSCRKFITTGGFRIEE